MLKRIARFMRKMLIPVLDPHAVFALIFQSTNKCNSKCLMCFQWKELNKNLDTELTLPEIEELTRQMKDVPSVTIGGGEPFLREDLPQICELFEKNCNTRLISIPTNALLPDRILAATKEILQRTKNAQIIIGPSIDGIGKLHDRIRGVKGNYQKLQKTYAALAGLNEPRLVINANTTVSDMNVGQMPSIISFVEQQMPAIRQHTFEVIRGCFDKNRARPPTLLQYSKIIPYAKNPVHRYYHLKAFETIKSERQVVPCRAGPHTPVIDAHGNVYACELLPALGNIREKSYSEIWRSAEWKKQQEHIRSGRCTCSHICFLMPSIYLNTYELAKLLLYRAWARIFHAGRRQGN